MTGATQKDISAYESSTIKKLFKKGGGFNIFENRWERLKKRGASSVLLSVFMLKSAKLGVHGQNYAAVYVRKMECVLVGVKSDRR